jgi:hypothetical protein
LTDDHSQIQKVPYENITNDSIYHETEQPTTVKNNISIDERDKLKNQQQYQSWGSRSKRTKRRNEQKFTKVEKSSDSI